MSEKEERKVCPLCGATWGTPAPGIAQRISAARRAFRFGR